MRLCASPARIFRYATDCQKVGNHLVALPSAKRVWIGLAVLVLLLGAVIGFYFHRPPHTPPAAATAGTPVAPASPESPESPREVAQTVGVLNQLPGDAPALAYIDVQSLRKFPGSPVAAILGLTDPNATRDPDYQQFVRATGFDYTRDLDRGAIALWPDGLGEAPQAAANDNRVFVVAEGRFDQNRIRAYVGKLGASQLKGTATIYEVPGTPPIAFEFLSPTRIALTSGSRSADLLIRPHSTTRDRAFQARIDRVAGAPLFAVARTDKLPDSLYASLKNSPEIETLIRSILGLTFTAQPQGGILKVALDGEANSTKNALAISTLLEISRMGASLALSDSKTTSQLTSGQAGFLDALLRQSRISRQSRVVRIALDVTPEMLGAAASAPSAPHTTVQNSK